MAIHPDDLKLTAQRHHIKPSAMADLTLCSAAFDEDGKMSLDAWVKRWTDARPHAVEIEPDQDEANKLLTDLGAQAAYVKAHGLADAKAMMQKIGGALGQIQRPKAGEKADPKAPDVKDQSANPWSDRYRSPKTAEADRIGIIRRVGTAAAISMAAAAGKTIAGTPLRKR
ncbi:hypothetical protein [Bradyrhizobium sp. USDA 4508]